MTDPVATEEIFPCIRADAESDLGYIGDNGRTKPVLIEVRDLLDITAKVPPAVSAGWPDIAAALESYARATGTVHATYRQH